MSEENKTLNVHNAHHKLTSDKVKLFVVKATGKDGKEHEMEFPVSTTSTTIMASALKATSTTLPPEALKEVEEQIEYGATRSTYISEFAINIAKYFSITIKRSPKETIKYKIENKRKK